jgi:hypothetical protein
MPAGLQSSVLSRISSFFLEGSQRDRISFVAPESASGARVLAELIADVIRDAGGSPLISSEERFVFDVGKSE